MTNSNNNSHNSTNDHLVSSSLVEFLYVIAKWKRFFIIFIGTIVTAGTLYAVFTPKIYKATASVLPSDNQLDILSGLGGMTSLAKSFSPLKGLGALSGSDETDKYIAILKSNTVLNDIINRFHIRKVYDMEDSPNWKVAKELQDNLEFEVEDEGNLTISVFDENPKLAADIANHMVNLLNNINMQLHTTNAKAVREFVEKRYFQNLTDITNLETDMKVFQQKNGVIAVPEQLEATFKTISTLYADLTKKEIEYSVMSKTMDPSNPAVKMKEMELLEFKSKLDKITSSSDAVKTSLVPLSNAPELVGQYLNIYKNLEIQYKIAEFITPVYEQAKIEEIKNTPSVLVLDRAFPPDRKAKPKISLYFLISLLSSFFISILIVFTLEGITKIKKIAPDKYDFINKSLRTGLKKYNPIEEKETFKT